MTRHVSEECFNQNLFILSKGLESCLDIPWAIVQKEVLHHKTLGSGIVQNLLMATEQPNASGKRLQPGRPHCIHCQKPRVRVFTAKNRAVS